MAILKKSCDASSSHNDVPRAVEDTAKPIGNVVKISGEESQLKNHYNAFEFHGHTYKLGDFVLFSPEPQGKLVKPYVAIIKDIRETKSKEIMCYAQWFYRPEDIPPRKGQDMHSADTRELFYSFHKDEVPAKAVIHKCKVHFITNPSHIPSRKQYPGFIVQKLYSPNNKRLSMLTDNEFLPDTQQEINMFVQMTMRNLNIFPDNESIDHAANIESVDRVNHEDV